MDYLSTHLSPPTPNRSRSPSLAHSTHSLAASTYPILGDVLSRHFEPLQSQHPASVSNSNLRSTTPLPRNDYNVGVSLSTHYLPTKFSNPLVNDGPRRRQRRNRDSPMPKMGGGVDAFKSGAARMAVYDEDDADDEYRNLGDSMGFFRNLHPGHKRKLRWNRFKWVLFLANTFLTVYSLGGLILCLLTWFDIWTNADVIRVGNRPELVISTLCACIGIFTSLIGWAGVLLNNRPFLATYTFLLWIVFIFLVLPGYLTYKRREFNIEGKINAQWSRQLGAAGRLRIQNKLGCCGYFSPFVEATVSQTCYARSILPGCKAPYIEYEKRVLEIWYTTVFSLVPLHIFVIVAGLLCSNHVTYRFGKGMMPKAYRLSLNSMAIIMDNYATQLAEQYGPDKATLLMARSASNLGYDPVGHPSSPAQSTSGTGRYYDVVPGRTPETAA